VRLRASIRLFVFFCKNLTIKVRIILDYLCQDWYIQRIIELNGSDNAEIIE